MAEKDTTTEALIKETANKLFMQKGYANTKTRDIAQEAGINLALLNYYFRSKEKLFKIIMEEKIGTLVQSMRQFFDSDMTLEDKLDKFISNYHDMLIQQPDMPLFVLSELRSHPGTFMERVGFKKYILNTKFYKQLEEAIKDGTIKTITPLHFIINMAALTVFPFIAKPIVQHMGELDEKQYKEFMTERKENVLRWFFEGVGTG